MSEERLKEMNLSEMLFNRDERLLDYITNLQEKLEVAQDNEESYRLEMQDITKCLGLDEHILFDDVKDYATNLQQENKIIKAEEHFFTECGFTNVEQLALCYVDYKSRIDKAVEYIENCQLGCDFAYRPLVLADTPSGEDLLNILNGRSDE